MSIVPCCLLVEDALDRLLPHFDLDLKENMFGMGQ